jgi:hypothetical protein
MDRAGLSHVARAFALIALASAALPGGVHQLFPTAIFSFDQHPDLPLREYAAGRLGIVQPTYARSYLYAAYRWMNGAPMTGEEIEQLDGYWKQRLAEREGGKNSEAPQAYDAIRGSLDIPWQAPDKPNSAAAAQYLAVDYIYYSKCSDDAFTTAADTLRARIASFGEKSPEVAEWVRGQDYVFENCFGAGSGFIPPAAPSGADPLIRADRDYQIAAALFYSSRYREAAAAFRRIAADQGSPWAGWGRYLAGRSLLWDARTNAEETDAYRTRLQEAAAELRAAAGGDGPQEARDAARQLLARILMRTDAGEAASMLSGRLLSPLGSASRAAELRLFCQLMDNLSEDPGALAAVREEAELVDWIFTFQEEGDAAAEHAMQRWRADLSVAWLIAAIAKISPDHPAVEELLAAAEVEGHPGGPSLAYYRARLMAERGGRDRALAEVDKLLPQLRGLDSSRNRALSLRATLARNAEEMLFFGVRPPAFVSYMYWSDGAYFNPWRLEEKDRAQLEPLKGAMRWGPETAEILNTAVTIDALIPMIDVQGQPERLRTELLLAAWTRAVLLDRWDLVRRLAPRAGEAAPSMRADMESLLAVTDLDEMRYFAAAALLKTPGASIMLRSGPIRFAPIDQADPKGLNWWATPPPDDGLLDFLDEEQRRFLTAEWDRIRKAGDGYGWLSRQVLAEADRPEPHASTAESLYRLVTCLDGVDLRWGYQPMPMGDGYESRSRAVEALKRRFPDSEWTGKAAAALETTSWY